MHETYPLARLVIRADQDGAFLLAAGRGLPSPAVRRAFFCSATHPDGQDTGAVKLPVKFPRDNVRIRLLYIYR